MGGRESGGLSSGSNRDPVEALAEEFLERRRRGEQVEISDYVDRHPSLAARIHEVFPTLLALERVGAPSPILRDVECRPDDPLPRRLGDYRLVREIGRGGMGIVYEAIQESLGRRVALKFLPSHAQFSAAQRERFVREARAAASLQHANIVPVYAVGGETADVPYYAMQLIHGESLERVLDELKTIRSDGDTIGAPKESVASTLFHEMLSTPAGEDHRVVEKRRNVEAPPGSDAIRTRSSSTNLLGLESDQIAFRQRYFRNVARIGAQVASALAYAHSEGIVHRDIKPSNILLDAHGTIWVADFGLAKATGSESLTRAGDVVGTLAYMAPERLDGWSDARSDIYGLGATLYELLTLAQPFQASDRHRLVKMISEEEPKRPSKLEPRLPRDLETIVLKAMEKNPERRYRSAEALASDLEHFLAFEPVDARPTGALGRALKWVRRRPAAAAALVLLVFLVGALGVIARGNYLARLEATRARYRELVVEAIVETERGRSSWETPERAVKGPDQLRFEEEGGALRPALDDVDVVVDPRRHAIELLEEAIELVPTAPDAWFQRAKINELLGEREGAIADLDEALRLDRGFEPAQITRRRIAATMAGEVSDGEPDTDRSPSAPPANDENRGEPAERSQWAATWDRAAVAMETENWSEAERAYGELIALESREGEHYLGESLAIRLNSGRCRFRQNDYAGALAEFRSASARWPSVMEPVLLEAATWESISESERAAETLDRFAGRAGDPATFAFEVARLYGERLGDPRRALEWLEKARPGLERETLRGRLALHLGEVEEAEDAARRALVLDDESLEARLLSGRVHMARNEYGEARRSFERAIAVDEESPVARYWLGQALRELGEQRRALESFQLALDLTPESASYEFNVAYSFGMLEDRAEATRHYELVLEALEAGESSGLAFATHNNLANQYLGEKRHSEALEHGLAALRIDRSSPFAIKTVKEILEARLEELRATTSAAPALLLASAGEITRLAGDGVPGLFALRGRLRASAGDYLGAVLDLERAAELGHEVDSGLLASYRRSLLPDLASVASTDAALEALEAGSEEESALLDGLRALELDDRRLALGAYLEGRILERAKRFQDAARAFQTSLAASGPRPAVCLRLADSLLDANRPAESEAWLRRFFNDDLVASDPSVTDRWLHLALGELGWKPSEALARLPKKVLKLAAWEEIAFSLGTLAAHGDTSIDASLLAPTSGGALSSRLYAAALAAISPDLWTDLALSVNSGALSRTREIDGSGGEPFEDLPLSGALLLGFRVTLGTARGNQVVSSVQPIFLGHDGRYEGQVSGKRSAASSELVARPGYAVGGLRLRKGEHIECIELVFMKIRERSAGSERLLDPHDSYRSKRVGSSGATQALDSTGYTVAGVFGRRDGDFIRSLGLVLASSRASEVPLLASSLSALVSATENSDERDAVFAALHDLARTGSREALVTALPKERPAAGEGFKDLARGLLRDLARGEPYPAPALHIAESLEEAGGAPLAESWLEDVMTRGGDEHPRLLDRWLRLGFGALGRKPSEILARLPGELPDARAWQETVFALQALVESGDSTLEPDALLGLAGRSESSAIYAAALRARSPDLWRSVAGCVSTARVDRTREVDGVGGGPFEDVPNEGGLLVGVRLSLATFEGDDILSALEGVYLGVRGCFTGERSGKPWRDHTWQEVVARPGYAVGGVSVCAGGRVHGLGLVFMRIRRGRTGPTTSLLDPSDAYRVTLIGDPRECEEIGADGDAVVGMFGRRGNDVDSLGLVLARPRFLTTAEGADAAAAELHPLIPPGSTWRLEPASDLPPAGWTGPDFDDKSWLLLREGTEPEQKAEGRCFLRHSFRVDRPADFEELVLSVEADADLAVSLNGARLHELRLETPESWIPYESAVKTTFGREDGALFRLRLPLPSDRLREGENLLAIDAQSMDGLRVSLAGERAAGRLTTRLAEAIDSARTSGRDGITAYIVARVLQERDELDRAIERYESARRDPELGILPLLREAECQIDAGRRKNADATLLKAFESPALWRDNELFDSWLGLVFAADQRSAAELLDLLDPEHQKAIADSWRDWSNSGTQGERGWFAGYYNRSRDADGVYQPDDFVAFDASSWTGGGWTLRRGTRGPWTGVSRERQHPNGTNSGSEHWAIRRWVSDRNGEVDITWHARKTNPEPYRDGVEGKLFLDGIEIDSAVVSTSDMTGVTRRIRRFVSVGSRVDLALVPRESDRSDGSAACLRVSETSADADRSEGVQSMVPRRHALAVLREFVNSGALRINCGAQDARQFPGGVPWSEDRFFQAGGSSKRAGKPPLYEAGRWFAPGGPLRFPAYRIPLPRGRYRVTLRHMEDFLRAPAIRLFDTFAEGVPVVASYAPGARGFLRPDLVTFDTDVADGFLDIEFRRRIENPRIHAIEIRRLAENDPAEGTPLAAPFEAPAPDDRDRRYARALRLEQLARQLAYRSRLGDAEFALREATDVLKDLAGKDYRRQRCHGDLERVLTELSSLLWRLGRGDEGGRLAEEASLYAALADYTSADLAFEHGRVVTLLPEGAEWRLWRGSEAPPDDWQARDFDDSAWETGPSGFGYDDGDDATVLDDMRYAYSTVYIRRRFRLPRPSAYTSVTLDVRVDDGCVVYLNGEEVGRVRAGAKGRTLAHDAFASAYAPDELDPVSFVLPTELLGEENVMAIQGLNHTLESSDFSLIPVLRATVQDDLLTRLRARGVAEYGGPVVSYIEGRSLQRAGALDAARAVFEELVRHSGDSPEPTLRLAECLRADGQSERARALLEELVERLPSAPLRAWDAWNLSGSAAAIGFDLEKAAAAVSEDQARETGILWALRQLRDSSAIRLNCGDREFTDRDGTLWQSDRVLAETGKLESKFVEVSGTKRALLYQTERSFSSDPAVYRIPLPGGRYRISLHFAEILFREPGKRVFDVVVEGRAVLRDFDPCQAGFAVAQEKAFDVEIQDGYLDIVFFRRADNPKISAIEVFDLDYLEARALAERGDLAAATAGFESLVERPGEHVLPVLRLAECLDASGDSVRARQLLAGFRERNTDVSLPSAVRDLHGKRQGDTLALSWDLRYPTSSKLFVRINGEEVATVPPTSRELRLEAPFPGGSILDVDVGNGLFPPASLKVARRIRICDEFEGDRLDPAWTFRVPVSGPTIDVRASTLRFETPSRPSFDNWTDFDRAPTLERSDMGEGDWTMSTRVSWDDEIGAPVGTHHVGLMFAFGSHEDNDLVYWGRYNNLNVLSRGRSVLIVERTGQLSGERASEDVTPLALQIEKSGETYTFRYRSRDDEPWIEHTRRFIRSALPVTRVGLIIKTFGGDGAAAVTADFDSFCLELEDHPPRAVIVARPTSDPGVLTFSGCDSSDPSGGRLVSFKWDFGDGESAEGETIEHVYAGAGTYPVTLTVTDDENNRGSATTVLSVGK